MASSHRNCGKPEARRRAQALSAHVCMPHSGMPFLGGESWTMNSWTVPF